MTLVVDPDEYPSPVDGDIAQEIKEGIKESMYDIDGVEIKNINVIKGDK